MQFITRKLVCFLFIGVALVADWAVTSYAVQASEASAQNDVSVRSTVDRRITQQRYVF